MEDKTELQRELEARVGQCKHCKHGVMTDPFGARFRCLKQEKVVRFETDCPLWERARSFLGNT